MLMEMELWSPAFAPLLSVGSSGLRVLGFRVREYVSSMSFGPRFGSLTEGGPLPLRKRNLDNEQRPTAFRV